MPSASMAKPKPTRMGDEDKPAAKVVVLPYLLTAEEATSTDSSVATVHPKKAEELARRLELEDQLQAARAGLSTKENESAETIVREHLEAIRATEIKSLLILEELYAGRAMRADAQLKLAEQSRARELRRLRRRSCVAQCGSHPTGPPRPSPPPSRSSSAAATTW